MASRFSSPRPPGLLPLPEVVFSAGIVVLCLLSFLQPFLVAVDTPLAGELTLCLMHAIVAAAVLVMLGDRRRL